MKPYILTIGLIALLSLAAAAKKLPVDNAGKVTYTNVVNVAEANNALYKRAEEWCIKNFSNNEFFTETADSKTGKIICKPSMNLVGFGYNYVINYTLSIYIKEGKYKYEATNFVLTDYTMGGSAFCGSIESIKVLNNKKIEKQFEKNVNSVVTSLTTSMAKDSMDF